MMKIMHRILSIFILIISNLAAQASSHRDSAFIANNPAVDATDLYAFTSYEAGREDFITIIANYSPIQNPGSGPNFYLFDPNALYEIKIDTDGNGNEDRTFRFKFKQTLTNNNQGLSVVVGTKSIPTPLINTASFSLPDSSSQNRELSYSIDMVTGRSFNYNKNSSRIRSGRAVKHANDAFITELIPPNDKTFFMPEYNIGSKSIADYDSYASNFVHQITIPAKKKKNECSVNARVFAGVRQESFAANLAGIYDLINTNLEAAENGSASEFTGNVLSIALELPKACIGLEDDNSSIGVWTAAYLPARRILRNRPNFKRPELVTNQDYVQVSRLGNPFVNQFLIGFRDKNLFNASRPRQDQNSDFIDQITYPALATIIGNETSLTAPTQLPRTDMEEIFLTGIPGLNQLSKTREVEMLRLNTATTAVSKAAQNRLGVIGGDNAGYPNGRRPGDDVTDVFLRLLMGSRLDEAQAPSKNAILTDGVIVDDSQFNDSFPYLSSP